MMTDQPVPEMRSRLEQNRYGKLTVGQWLDIVFQPAMALFVLLIPLGFLLLPRFLVLMMRGGWVLFFLLLMVFLGTFVLRALRYARAPVHYAQMQALRDTPPVWQFWAPLALRTEDEQDFTFYKRLAPRPHLRRGELYDVYFLQDAETCVLLSIVPSDHPDAESFLPTPAFYTRKKLRS